MLRYLELLDKYEINKENVDEILEEAGVFKMDEQGIDALNSFGKGE